MHWRALAGPAFASHSASRHWHFLREDSRESAGRRLRRPCLSLSQSRLGKLQPRPSRPRKAAGAKLRAVSAFAGDEKGSKHFDMDHHITVMSPHRSEGFSGNAYIATRLRQEGAREKTVARPVPFSCFLYSAHSSLASSLHPSAHDVCPAQGSCCGKALAARGPWVTALGDSLGALGKGSERQDVRNGYCSSLKEARHALCDGGAPMSIKDCKVGGSFACGIHLQAVAILHLWPR